MVLLVREEEGVLIFVIFGNLWMYVVCVRVTIIQ